MKSEGKINILLVDDRPEELLAIEAIIEKDKYRLVKASSGEEPLKWMYLAYQKLLKNVKKTKNIPILFITAKLCHSQFIKRRKYSIEIDYAN